MRRNTRFTGALTREVVGGAIVIGIIGGILFDVTNMTYSTEYALAAEPEVEIVERKEVRIEVVYNWDKVRIEAEIRKAFPETPNTAVAIAKCESGLTVKIQSQHILSYGQEQSFGLFQIHAPDHEENAVRLGYGDYRTNPVHNIAYARWLYDTNGGWTDWTCYNAGLYWNHL